MIFFLKTTISAGILFCVKNGLFCHINERNFVVEKIILIFVAKTECITLLENYDMKKLCTALMAMAVVAFVILMILGVTALGLGSALMLG